MSALTKNIFRNFAAPVALGLGAVASAVVPFAANAQERPVAAQPVAANTNIATPTVQFIDAQNDAIPVARRLAAVASRDKVAIVVWGGNRTIQQEAYNAARDLVGMGIPTAFVLAPDDNGLDADAAMTVYAASLPRSDSRWGTNYASEVRTDMREAGIEAYRTAFPAQLAQLSL